MSILPASRKDRRIVGMICLFLHMGTLGKLSTSLCSHSIGWNLVTWPHLTAKKMSLAKWPSAQPNFLLPLMREQILGGSTVMLVSVYSPIFHSPTKNHPFGQPGLLSSPSAPRILLSTPLLALSPYMGFPSPFPCPPQSCTSFKAVLSPPWDLSQLPYPKASACFSKL